jgi:DNA-binding transcriptional LysR family regulator
MVFESVLESGSFVRAANSMSLTQPAVTKAIFDLESVLGAPLFERSNRGVTPTEFGVVVGRRVKSLISELRDMTEEVNTFRTGEAGHVIVGTLIAGAAKLLPRAIVRLREKAPSVFVTVREGTPGHLFPALATGDLDIVVGRIPEQELPLAHAFPLTHEALFSESFCAVVGHKNPLVQRDDIQLLDLMNAQWILPLPESPAHNAAQRLFRNAGLPVPAARTHSLSILTNIGILLETEMIALMPRAAALQFARPGLLAILNLPNLVSFGNVGFSIRADKEVNPACKNFIECLREATKGSYE